jgi:hypothetical protein
MNTTPRVLDLTGLPDDAIAAVEQLVAVLKKQSVPKPDVPAPFGSREEWRRAFREWAETPRSLNNAAEWDRETIYAGRE